MTVSIKPLIEQILKARQDRAEKLHVEVVKAREAIRLNLSPDSPQWMREAFNGLQSIKYGLAGDPFDMHIRAALAHEEQAEPVAWLVDRDGTGSLHPASKGDDGAFPVYAAPVPPQASVPDLVTKAMVNAAWNAGKQRCMTGSPHDFRIVIEAALAASPRGASCEGRPMTTPQTDVI